MISSRDVDEVSGRSTKFVKVALVIEPFEVDKPSNFTKSNTYVPIGQPGLAFGNAGKVRVY